MLSGSFSFTDDQGRPGIVISQYAANILHCRIGDELTLFVTTYGGQPNAATLVVRGIFNETSLFGFAAYMDRVYLNQLIQRDQEFCTDIALYLKDGTDSKRLVRDLSSYLGNYRTVAPLFVSREERDAKLPEVVNKGPTLVILTQDRPACTDSAIYYRLFGNYLFILVLFCSLHDRGNQYLSGLDS